MGCGPRDTVNRLSCALALLWLLAGGNAAAGSILFIGNSFTYDQGSALRFYRGDTLTHLNGEGIGGVPALFKSFTDKWVLPMMCFSRRTPQSGSTGMWTTNCTE